MIRYIFRIEIIIRNTVLPLSFALGTNRIRVSFTNRNNTLGMLVSPGFALGTNRLGGSFTNSNNTLGMLESLGFASGLSLPLGIITTLVND